MIGAAAAHWKWLKIVAVSAMASGGGRGLRSCRGGGSEPEDGGDLIATDRGAWNFDIKSVWAPAAEVTDLPASRRP
mgnify:CR=1 FL=1